MARGGRNPKKNELGQALCRQAAKGSKSVQSSAGRFVAKVDGGDADHDLASYLEGSSLDDFLRDAVLSNREFVAEKERVMVLEGNGMPVIPESEMKTVPMMDFKDLKLPRRPKWDKNTTKSELNRLEKDSFLNWRRDIAGMEASSQELTVTPFEKNLEVWRQLWRVIERSDVLIQILDARNPLFYRSNDLEKYVKEVNDKKMNVLLVNKADYLTLEQRNVWGRYFEDRQIKTIFFSARTELEKLDEIAKLEREAMMDDALSDEESSDEESEDSEEDAALENELKEDQVEEQSKQDEKVQIESNAMDQPVEQFPVLDREELLALFAEMVASLRPIVGNRSEDGGRIKLGMVGYPNVGKSSVINALLGAATNAHGKRVAVGSTPGKTKHFQTLILSDEIMLCDCPGLVFPSFISSSSEMICSGVLSLAQLRSHIEPTLLLCRRIPKIVLEHTYGIKIPTLKAALPTDPVDPYAFLETYARIRGFTTTGKGGPDSSRAARVVLKDYVVGKLLYCHPPPDLSQDEQPYFDPHQINADLLPVEVVPLQDPEEPKQDLMEDAETKKKAVSRRLKKHGKKGRKGRDKNPYDDSDMLGDQANFAAKVAGRKHRNRNFVRSTLPHHATYGKTL